MLRRLRDFLLILLKQPDFTIRIADGRASLWQGHSGQAFVAACGEIAADQQIENALIFGCRRARGRVLEFSGLPESLQQPYRNAWQLYKGKD